MNIRSNQLDEEAAHKLLKSCVAPRPVAWISTVSEDGRENLAPFSCYTFVATRPPMICLSIARKGSGKKDTLVNIERTGEFVVNVAPFTLAKEVTATAADLPPDQSEWDSISVRPVNSSFVKPPRIAQCPVALECKLHSTQELGESRHTLVIGEVLAFHIDDDFFQDGEVDLRRLQPLARLSGDLFLGPGEVFEVRRDK